ncbi:hypothetical protein ScPMuIL_009678 [Solemya velum]
MATHYICHSTEPHRYSSTGADKKDHGAVSRYEILNMAPKSHTQFPPSDWSWSQTSEDDSLPLLHSVPPTKRTESAAMPAPGPDPDLCVTPIKTLMNVKKHQAHPALCDPDLSLTFDNRDDAEDTDSDLLPKVIPKSVEENKIPVLERDPNLSLTPDHSAKGKLYNHVRREEIFDSTVGAKVRHRVRFDLQDDDSEYAEKERSGVAVFKHYEPNVYGETVPTGGPSDAFSNKTIQYTVKHMSDGDDKPAHSQTSNDDGDDPQTIFSKQCKPNMDFGLPKRKIIVKREAPVKPALKEYSIQETNDVCVSEPEHVFNRPEFHSTLKMTSEIKQLKESVIDVGKAMKKRLQLTDRTSEQINEKASMKTNRESTTFLDLICLDVPVEDLCTQVQRKQAAKVTKSMKLKQASTGRREPDLLEFFNTDIQREVADFSQTRVPPPVSSLCTATHKSAFDLYLHNQAWESI